MNAGRRGAIARSSSRTRCRRSSSGASASSRSSRKRSWRSTSSPRSATTISSCRPTGLTTTRATRTRSTDSSSCRICRRRRSARSSGTTARGSTSSKGGAADSAHCLCGWPALASSRHIPKGERGTMPNHSVLIVGAGISGMRAALAAKERASDVALISKVHPLRTHAGTSQGGINAALRMEDSAALHAEDTVKGGDYLADQNVVELLTATAPRAVITLDHWGVPFNRNGDGRLDARRLCGATHPRAAFVDDMTGHATLQVLHEQLLKAGIRTYEEWAVTKLLLDDGACVGVVALELASGKVEAFPANAVVLATGGSARVYEPTGAAYGVTGDGVALAYRAGAPLMDMEMVQFHPLGIKGSGMILSEALLGLGGYLINASGERFALKTAPTLGERAPRDVVARAA